MAVPKNYPNVINTTIELQNINTTSDNTGTLVSCNTPRQMPLLSEILLILLELNGSNNSKWTIFGLCHYCVQRAICPFFVFVVQGASSQFSVFPCVPRSPGPRFHHSITVILSWLPVCTHRMICSTWQCHWMLILLHKLTAYCFLTG